MMKGVDTVVGEKETEEEEEEGGRVGLSRLVSMLS